MERRETLPREEAREVMQQILLGQMVEVEIAALLGGAGGARRDA